MRVDIITIFPELFRGILECGILRRAVQAGIAQVRILDLRDFTTDKHRSVDDRPYGGGEGMVLMPEPLFRAVESCRQSEENGGSRVVLLSPQGKTWHQRLAREFASESHIILICGRYEGVDQRVVDTLVDCEISIGDFVLTGGEIPAMVLLDSAIRLLPGALGSPDSSRNESFSLGMLDYPQYTRPSEFRGMAVPDVLLTGDHAKIYRWRQERALERTRQLRPDILEESEFGR